MLTSAQFEATRRLALRLAGIELAERHREVLARRIRRLGIHDAAGVDALIRAADRGDAAATRQFVGLLTTNFTGFFRHPQHFKLAAEHALQAVRLRGTARLWSAAAATGEEPYSLAMALIDVFQQSAPTVGASPNEDGALPVFFLSPRGTSGERTEERGHLNDAPPLPGPLLHPMEVRESPVHRPASQLRRLPVTILATDIDEDALTIARQGEFAEPALSAVPADHRTRFFSPATRARHWRINQAVRDRVEFRALNLTDLDWPIAGPFDVVLCRNVLMYLEANHRYAVLERLASVLAPDGLLMLDPAEHLGKAAHLFARGQSGVYPGRAPTRNPGDLARVGGNRN